MTGSDKAVTTIDLATLERLSHEMVEYAHDVMTGESDEGDQFVSDVMGFKVWVTTMRALGCEGKVTR